MTSRTSQRVKLVWLGAIFLAPAGLAQAQTTASFDDSVARDGMFSRRQAVSVFQRQHPDYTPIPIQAGAFNISPSLRVEAGATDNLLADPVGKSDVLVTLSPAVRAESNWSRNALELFAQADATDYARQSSYSAVLGSAGFNSRWDLQQGSAVQAGASLSRDIEDPTAPGATANLTGPAKYDQGVAYLGGAWTLNRLRLTAQGRYDGRRFQAADTGAGSLQLKFRDIDIYQVATKAEYALSPALSGFVTVTANKRKPGFTLPGVPSRDSKGYTAEGGVNFQAGGLWRGEIGMGYLSQDFESPLRSDLSGFSINGLVEYFPTQLTTARLTIERGVNEPGIPLASALLLTRGTLEIDHELLRNTILIGRLSAADSEYSGIDRDDRTWSASFQVQYLMNRAIALSGGLRHFERSSSGASAGRTFDVNRLNIGLNYRF